MTAMVSEGRARWTGRLVAQEAVKRKLVPRVGRDTIPVLFESHDLKPWREKMWCVAELDGEYIEKMEGVSRVEKPYDPAEPVVCPGRQIIEPARGSARPVPAKPGAIAKLDNEYKRRGTANVFGAVEPKAGRHTSPRQRPPS